MKTGFILAMRTIKAIGATMPILEIMPTKASPLVVEQEVDELERTIQTTNILLLTVITTCSTMGGVLVVLGIRD